MFKLLNRIKRDRRGATLVEYALLIALIALAVLSAAQVLFTTTSGMWNHTSNQVSTSSKNAAGDLR